MFFLCALDEATEESTEYAMAVGVEFEGEPPGSLTLRISCGAARSIAADFLGDYEESISNQQVCEVVCELANIVCGSVLSRIESNATFRLGSPRILTPAERLDCSSGAVVHRVAVQNGRLDVVMRLEGSA